jgi:hypothetical protein
MKHRHHNYCDFVWFKVASHVTQNYFILFQLKQKNFRIIFFAFLFQFQLREENLSIHLLPFCWSIKTVRKRDE